MFEIRTFGPLEITDGKRVLGARDLGGVKPRQVLSILLAHRGRIVSKDRIADLLWGDGLPKNVAATLETYVSKLRRALETIAGGEIVVTEPGGYRLDMTEVDHDLDRFDRSSRGSRADLEAALALVRGEVFEEEVYATWAIRLRDEYRGKHLRALHAAAEAARKEGQHDVALARGNELLALDRTHELGYRVVLAALAALGRRDEVVRVFERCRAAMREELGVKPSAALVALYEEARTGASPAASTRPAVIEGTPRVLPFVGRDAELAVLERAVHDSFAGKPSLVLVEAEPGHGKTRLLDELARRSTARIARASCSPIDRELVFAPIASLVRELVAPDERERYPALGEIMPELGVSGLPPETARAQALESFVRIVTERAPIVVMIDDLQWADPSTIAAIVYLARRAERGVALLGCARAKTLAPDHPLRQGGPRIELGPLSRAMLLPYGEQLYERTGGNPLFVVELLRAGDAVPDTLRELLLARSSAAGEGGHRVLAVAAVLGRRFAPAVLARLLDDSLDAVLEQLDALRAHALVVERGDRFEFCHDLVREALYDSLSSSRRRRLHERAAAALDMSGAPPGEVAHHAEMAGSIELAVRASLRAADQARAAWANLEAVAHLDRALRLAVMHPDVLEPSAVDGARITLGRALVTVGRVADAESLLGAARADAEARGDERALFEILDALSFARQRGASAPTEALHHARAALAIAERLGEDELLARAHTLVGSPLTSLGQLGEAIDHNRAAIAIAEKMGEAPRAYPLGRIALTLHLQGKDGESLAYGARAEDAALAQHDEETVIMARWVRSLSCMALGRYSEAARSLDAIRDVGRGEEVFWHARVPNTWGALYSDLCMHERALACDEQSLESARKQRGGAVREAELHSLLNIAANRLALGQLDAARKAIEEVRRQVTSVEYARFRWLARMHAIAAELAAAQGDREGARQAADSCLALAEKYEQPRYQVRGTLARAIAHGDATPARSLATAAATQAEAMGWPGLAWRAWHVAGDLSRARRAVLKCAEGLDEPLRSEFLAAVPVSP
jgi:DNA-binding SARP family transcriptional activator/tetratricopeptide (TPR) repeat protein